MKIDCCTSAPGGTSLSSTICEEKQVPWHAHFHLIHLLIYLLHYHCQ